MPVFILAIIVALGLILKQELMLKIFAGFGKGMTFIATVSPGIAIFQYLTGLRLPLFNLMVEENEALGGVPLEVGLLLVGLIAIVLVGAFPMILFLNRRLGNVIAKFGKRTGINTESSTGLLTQLASSIPIWSVMGDMNNRGKLINIAFAVSGSFVLGDVLAFTGGANPEMVFPVIVAKLSGGILAIALTLFLLKRGKIKAD
ncbi:ethanolamine transporter EutH [Lachnospiraceae bacterium PF1-21]